MVVAEPVSPSRLSLVTGPSGSGKSRWAETMAHAHGRQVVYVATGPECPDDLDWQARLQRHRQRRPDHWHLLEVRGELASALASLSTEVVGLVDSIGTWVAAHLETDQNAWGELQSQLCQAISRCGADLILVTEEVSWGVVPATALGCRFRDRLSGTNLRLAAQCSDHWLVIQGRALDLRLLGVPVDGGG